MAARSGGSQELEELADPMRLLHGMPERPVGVDAVLVPPAGSGPLDVARADQVGDDRLRCTLSDADSGGNITTADAGIIGDTDEDVAVVGEERPVVVGPLPDLVTRLLDSGPLFVWVLEVIGAAHVLERSPLRECHSGTSGPTHGLCTCMSPR